MNELLFGMGERTEGCCQRAFDAPAPQGVRESVVPGAGGEDLTRFERALRVERRDTRERLEQQGVIDDEHDSADGLGLPEVGIGRDHFGNCRAVGAVFDQLLDRVTEGRGRLEMLAAVGAQGPIGLGCGTGKFDGVPQRSSCPKIDWHVVTVPVGRGLVSVTPPARAAGLD